MDKLVPVRNVLGLSLKRYERKHRDRVVINGETVLDREVPSLSIRFVPLFLVKKASNRE